MKKSKVIIPAMGILCLSTAAAVTGTVAWFTASRVKNISMSNIKVYNPESSLVMSLENIANTTVNSSVDPATVTHSPLRDASVDLSSTPAVWASVLDDNGDVGNFRSVASPYSAGTVGSGASEVDIFYATAFKASFNLNSAGGYSYELFFDSVTALPTVTALSAGTNDVLSALRIGIKTPTSYVVWAPRTVDASIKKITAANTAAAGVAESRAIIGSTALPTVTDDVLDAGYDTNLCYMGAVPEKVTSGTQNTLDLTIYTWFEGTDSKCVQDSKGIETAFAAGLSFKMIRSA